ncbi:MAG TPA: S26 family signal peptidase, partial [Ferruginibacter sp.]|nr:S26 family signal peptidase [Ferruginibacter sp.]
MDSSQITVLILIALLLVVLPSVGLYKLFIKAGKPGWMAFIPFYNTWIMLEVAKKPKWWFFAQVIPIAGWFFTLVILIEFMKCFNKFRFYQHAATVFSAGIYPAYVGFSPKTRFIGPEGVKHYKKSAVREWVDAAVFAIVAATLIRTFVFEAYTIPTPSMEKSLLVNDFLFVSKSTYGPRLPNTPIAMPFVHHTIPFLNTKSYVEWVHIPYTRWFASPVKRNDAVVFNFPVNDTLINDEVNFGSRVTYYEAVRKEGRDRVWQDYGDLIITRPVDKRENFIKRCVGIAGDTIQIIKGKLYVNGKPGEAFPQSQRYYLLQAPEGQFLDKERFQEFGINIREDQGDLYQLQNNLYQVNITTEEKAKLNLPKGYVLTDFFMPHQDDLFPYYADTTGKSWTADNFGPLWIPKKGASIPLNADNLIRYRRCIEVYEGNKLEERNGKYYINGTEAS